MAVPGTGTAPLNNPDHRAEHDRINPSLAKLPRGIVAYQLGTAVGLGIGNSNVAIYGLYNVQLFAGRLYLLAFSVRAIQIGPFQSGWPGRAYFTTNPFRPNGTTIVVDAYTFNNYWAMYENMTWEQPFTVKYDLTIDTLQIMVNAPASSFIWLDFGGHMRIEDIGADVGRTW